MSGGARIQIPNSNRLLDVDFFGEHLTKHTIATSLECIDKYTTPTGGTEGTDTGNAPTTRYWCCVISVPVFSVAYVRGIGWRLRTNEHNTCDIILYFA